jgi:undecaprenyl-diphosphatase
MLQSLIEADRKLFLLINQANDPVIDFIMFWATDKWIWVPFYIWLLYILIKNYGKKIFVLLIVVALLITISDQVSVMIKDLTQRLRPCRDPFFTGMIHLVNESCGGQYGFISSHACNTMALAVFITGILPEASRWFKAEIFAYVVLVCYSRIYLGAHFPGDIIGGWILGTILGFIAIFICRKYILKLEKLT